MSEQLQANLDELADALSLRIQQLRGHGLLDDTETLLNLDYSSQAAQAPFVFDMAQATVHRNGCTAIPAGSKSTLYALWELRAGDTQMACPVCQPQAGPPPPARPEQLSDLVFGVISFLDQFSSVLRERGMEYRRSNQGGALVAELEKLFGGQARTNEGFPPAAQAANSPGEPGVCPGGISGPKAASSPSAPQTVHQH